MKKVDNVLSPVKNCIGCTACVYACKNGSLIMDYDKDGFYVAKKTETCIQCGACENFCKQKDKIKSKLVRKTKPDTYVAWAKDKKLRSIGNSGGLFSAIAKHWILNEGVVVAPVYDDKFVPKYCIAKSQQQINLQAWSKFVQSELGDIFPKIKTILKQGTKVLFVGAPCQVKGLYAYLGEDYERLLTVQFPCIGMPPSWFYQEYLKDQSNCDLSDILEVYGEVRKDDSDKRIMKIVLKNGEHVEENAHSSVYVLAWNSFYTIRDSCCNCQDNIAPVCADLTWGNFWYLGTTKKCKQLGEMHTNAYSMLLTHSAKGSELVKKLESDSITIYLRSYKEACIGHLMFQAPANRHIIYKRYIFSQQRKKFQFLWRSTSFSELKQRFFSCSNQQSFKLASKLGIRVKGYIWSTIYYMQRVKNCFYEIFYKK